MILCGFVILAYCILDRLKYVVVRPPLLKPYPKIRRDKPLIMSQLGIVMMVLAAGLVMSIPLFLIELIKGRGKKTLSETEERKHLTLAEIEHLTLQLYGRTLEEYL